jgi:hypothetical protein
MRFGLSWGAQAPHHIEVAGMRYEVRTTRIAGVWTAYGTVGGVCVEATGNSEREARQKWQKTVTAMSPLLAVERRVEQALDEAAAALDDAAETIASQSHATQSYTAQSQAVGPSPHETPLASPAVAKLPPDASTPADTPPILPPETCEIPRSVDRRLRPRLPREL